MGQVVVQGLGRTTSQQELWPLSLHCSLPPIHAEDSSKQARRAALQSLLYQQPAWRSPHPQQLDQLCSDLGGQLCGGVLLGQEGRVLSWCQVGVAADLCVGKGAEVIV